MAAALPQARTGAWLCCKHLHLCCTCQARTDLEAVKCTCSFDFPSFIHGGGGFHRILHMLPSPWLAGWLRMQQASPASSSRISHTLCDLGQVLNLARFTHHCCGFNSSVLLTLRKQGFNQEGVGTYSVLKNEPSCGFYWKAQRREKPQTFCSTQFQQDSFFDSSRKLKAGGAAQW